MERKKFKVRKNADYSFIQTKIKSFNKFEPAPFFNDLFGMENYTETMEISNYNPVSVEGRFIKIYIFSPNLLYVFLPAPGCIYIFERFS